MGERRELQMRDQGGTARAGDGWLYRLNTGSFEDTTKVYTLITVSEYEGPLV